MEVNKMDNKQLTLGSLFDGIGGFPLAGKMAGIRPVWASEIEPFPIRVTEKRLPEMKLVYFESSPDIDCPLFVPLIRYIRSAP